MFALLRLGRIGLSTLALPLLSACAFVGASLWSAPAHAELTAGIFGGYGLPHEEDGDDVWRWGYGARAGYTFLLPVFIGASSTFHTGSRDPEADVPQQHLNYHLLEAGVDLTFGEFGLRPYLGAGVASLTTTRDADGGFLSPAIAAGLTPSIRFIDLPGVDLYAALDVRYVMLTRMVDNGDNRYAESDVPVYLSVVLRAF
jgi:hypothetical protein